MAYCPDHHGSSSTGAVERKKPLLKEDSGKLWRQKSMPVWEQPVKAVAANNSIGLVLQVQATGTTL
jgi:hypothetical protein